MENRYVIDWKRYADTARRAVSEGAVLLENKNQVLPFGKGSKIAVFGRMQLHYYKSGTGSGGLVNSKYQVGILDALKEETDIRLDEELERVYRAWDRQHPFDEGKGWGQEPWNQEEMPLEESVVKAAAKRNHVALLILGRTSGEDRDASEKAGSYLLTDIELDMLEKVCRIFPKTVVLLNTGTIIDMKWVARYAPDAVMYVWQGGMVGGYAAADLLLGRTTPSGKLTDTIADDISSYPSTANFGGPQDNVYEEDIYVGYRYFETFAKDKVLYPFGYGCSYTTFSIEQMGFSYENGTIQCRLSVKNTGYMPGKEVIQLYVNPPQGQLGKPVRNLAAFKKTKLLQPGEKTVLQISVREAAFASYDDTGYTGHKSCYVLEAGSYEIFAGTDVRSATVVGTFVIPELKVIQKCTEALSPIASFKRIRPYVDDEGAIQIRKEKVPVRSYDLSERMARECPDQLPYTGDRGYRLGDVYDGRISIEEFLAQLSDKALCCMVRGEGMSSPKVTPGTAGAFGGVTEELKGFGIPCGCCSDGPSGIRMDCGTYAFSIPSGNCLASTFNEELNTELFRYMGAELRKNRIDFLLGPGMNIHRNPLNGRNFEYFSEDPLVSGKIASAQLKGMHAYGVTGTIKHFAANNQEYNRRCSNSVVSERALREIYLKGFEIAVKEGGAYSVMTTYGAINGLWTASCYDLTTTILRGEWKYQGAVMTDWWAQMNEEGEKPGSQYVAAMLRCQNDLYMVVEDSLENSTGDDLEESLGKGTLTRGHLARSARNIISVLMRSPVMERSLGRMSDEERRAGSLIAEEDKVDFNLKYYPMKDVLSLDVSDADTGKGKSLIYGLQVEAIGYYDLYVKVRVQAGEVAQVPVTFFANGKLLGTVTMNGTNGKEVEITQNLGLFTGTNNFVKLYFAQSGMELIEMTVKLREKLTKPFWEL